MNIPESAGESSCKRQENGDGSAGSDRPLKKARFAWQVKGKAKYQAKNDTPDAKTSASPPETPECTNNASSSHSLVGNTEQNLEILGEYLLKQDFNTLDSVIADTDKSLLKPGTAMSNNRNENYVNNSLELSTSSKDEDASVSMAMVLSQNFYEEQCIARWQARQMAKGFVDNTINRVLDSWMTTPLPGDNENRVMAIDVAEFINNLSGNLPEPDDNVENEGILMAISAHGLQNSSGTSSSENSNMEEPNLDTVEEAKAEPIFVETKIPETEAYKMEDDSNIEMGMQDSETFENDSDSIDNFTGRREFSAPFLNPEDSGSTYLRDVFNGYEDLEECNEIQYNCIYDFMDAAVSYAIKNKGLTSLGTDYG